jgi:hypothetical protein
MNTMAAELALPAETGVPHFGVRISALAAGFALVVSAFAGDTPASADPAAATAPTSPPKGSYTLFNPTPRNQLREMATDRPDKTESPFTVDAGHFQVEMDLVNYTHDRGTSGGGDTRVTSYAVAPVNVKVGLLNNLDLQLVLETWNWVKTEDRLAQIITQTN